MTIRKVSFTLLYLLVLLISLAVLYYKNVNESKLYDIYVDNLITKKVSSFFPDLNIVIGATQVQKNNDGYWISLNGVLIRNSSNEVVGRIPKVTAIVVMKSFFSQSFVKSVYVENPQLLAWSQSSSFDMSSIHTIVDSIIGQVGDIEIKNFSLGQDINIKEVHLAAGDRGGKINFHLKKDEKSSVKAEIRVLSNSIFSLYFSNLELSLLRSMPKEYQGIAVSGYSTITLDKSWDIKSGRVVISAVSGPFKSGYGKLAINDQRVEIEHLVLGTSDGDVLVSGDYNYKQQTVNLDIKSQQLSVETVFNIWSQSWQEQARTWGQQHIIEGVLIEPSLHIENDVKQGYSYSFDSYFTDGKFIIGGLFSPLQGAAGRVSLHNDKLFVHVNKARIDRINIVDAIIKRTDIQSGDVPLYIYGSTESTTKAIYPLIKDGEKLDFLANIDGVVRSDFSFVSLDKRFDRYFSVELRESYDEAFFDLFKLSHGDAELNLHNDDWQLHGDVYLDGQPVDIVISGTSEDVKVHLDGKLPTSAIVKLKILNPGEIDGVFGYKLDIRHINDYNYIDGSLDLSNSLINLHSIDWYSDVGAPGRLDFHAINKGDSYVIPKLEIVGQDVYMHGMSRVKGNKLAELIFPKMKIQKNNIEFLYSKPSKELLVKADKLLLDNLDNNVTAGEEPITVKAAIGEAIFKNNSSISDLNVNISADYTNSYAYGNFSADQRFFVINKKHELVLWSSDAGLFCDAIGVVTSVNRGSLVIRYDHNKHYGNLIIKNFYLLEAPVLAKILSLVSLQGIVNTLNNEGIYFNQLKAPFSYSDNILSFDESWLEGLSLGISFAGQVDIMSRKVNLQGNVVPIYYLNKVIWQIPLFGALLTGGKGRGIISIDYNLATDSHGENQVSVNIMSILTPKLIQRVLDLL